MDGGLVMVLIFLFIVAVALSVLWYNKKYGKKIDAGTVIIVVFFLIGGVFFLIIKNMASDEKNNITKNISLKNTVVEILTDSHKQYFKDMKLDNGQILPMPEAMNKVLQAGDSIYKIKGENFYTIVNSKTKVRTDFDVKVHERVLSKPQ